MGTTNETICVAGNFSLEFHDDAINDRQSHGNAEWNISMETNNKSNGGDLHLAKKRPVVRQPQPKLNPERLCGDRGLIQLPRLFQSFSSQGRGYEKDDLDSMMKVLEHWSYRLFPCLPYHDVLEKIECLGGKKQLQTCLKKIRLDMMSDDTLSVDDITNKDDLESKAFHEESLAVCSSFAGCWPSPKHRPCTPTHHHTKGDFNAFLPLELATLTCESVYVKVLRSGLSNVGH